eukprot:TRINITY_DN5104_c0_g1_i1.p1 TRINITY_DN5104_c0_g1~~TRINITY_DN5104_c0_g1_i1.p1  ORF type:complete len:143 (+),score=36.56 TRINITY_DN5104_c0_g1_i1:35-463(+)
MEENETIKEGLDNLHSLLVTSHKLFSSLRCMSIIGPLRFMPLSKDDRRQEIVDSVRKIHNEYLLRSKALNETLQKLNQFELSEAQDPSSIVLTNEEDVEFQSLVVERERLRLEAEEKNEFIGQLIEQLRNLQFHINTLSSCK